MKETRSSPPRATDAKPEMTSANRLLKNRSPKMRLVLIILRLSSSVLQQAPLCPSVAAPRAPSLVGPWAPSRQRRPSSSDPPQASYRPRQCSRTERHCAQKRARARVKGRDPWWAPRRERPGRASPRASSSLKPRARAPAWASVGSRCDDYRYQNGKCHHRVWGCSRLINFVSMGSSSRTGGLGSG